MGHELLVDPGLQALGVGGVDQKFTAIRF
jgi:hypothetical protein